MKYVRLFQRHGHNPAGSEIALSDTQAQWMADNGHGEFVKGKTVKTDAPPFLNAAPPAESTTSDTGNGEHYDIPTVELVQESSDDDPVKVVDTSSEPTPDAAPPVKRKGGRPRKNPL